MNIRLLDPIEAMRIYRKHYKDEFSFPDFYKHYITTFSVEETNGETILVGGVRAIPEIVLLTDLDKSVPDRQMALLTALDYSIANMQYKGHDSLHAFVKDPKWSRRLKRTGFKPIQGEGLILEI